MKKENNNNVVSAPTSAENRSAFLGGHHCELTTYISIMDGWVKLHRKVLSHWIIDDPHYFKAWVIILLEANHSTQNVVIEREIFKCHRGERLYSLSTWCKKFGKGWSIQKVRTFFKLLKSDGMIELKGLRKTTRLTICNYDTYQDQQQTDNKQITSKQQTDNKQITTIKNDKKEKNDKNDKETPTWKTNFDEYLKIVNNGYQLIINDKKEMDKQQEFYPNVDIKKSLEKSIHNFWGTKAGWENKKKKRSKTIDMKRTLLNNLDKNKVWKDKNNATQNTENKKPYFDVNAYQEKLRRESEENERRANTTTSN